MYAFPCVSFLQLAIRPTLKTCSALDNTLYTMLMSAYMFPTRISTVTFNPGTESNVSASKKGYPARELVGPGAVVVIPRIPTLECPIK